MATTSYSNLFGTNGAGQQTTSNLFGQQAAAPKQQYQPPQNFAQMQQQGMARPAPPQAKPFQQYGGSQQAQQARSAMLGQLQQQLAQPTRFDTEAFKQIRGAQQAQLGQEYKGMQQELEERLARQGLSASTFGSGRFGDLAGQQSRALASLDAQLLQQAAQTQAQDRLAAMQAGQQFAELAGAQDLAQFEANRVGQATEFEQGLRAAEFGQRQFEQAETMGLSQAQLGEQARQFDIQQQLAQTMGLGQLGIQQQGINVDLARLAETSAERQLREQLGLSEIAGVVYARNAAGDLVPATDEQKKQVQTLAARQMAQQQAQFTSQLGETTAARLAQTTQAQQELAFRQQLAQAEVTGNMDIPVLDATGKPTGQMQRVSSLAANRLGMEGTQLALQQASQLSQQTGFAYTVGDDGKPTQLIDPVTKAPIRTESSAARLTQQELQQAELRGYIEQPDPTNPGKTVKVDTLSAKNLNQQQLNFLAEQASQRSQQSGFVFGVTDGKVAQVLDTNGQPIRTESAAARLSQQELQRAEIRGYFEEPSPSDPTKKVPVSTVAAKQLTQQQVRDAVAQADMMSRQSGYQFKIEIDAQGNPTVEPMYAKKADGTDDFTRQLTTEAARAQQAQEAQATAERNLRERLGLSEISGIIYETKNGVLTPSADQTMARRQLTQGRADALTQATGILHMVDEKGEVVPRTGTDGKPITTANIQQMDMDRRLRQMLGMTEATGVVFNANGEPVDIGGGQPLLTQQALQAQQSLMVQLAGIMSGATTLPPQYNTLLQQLMAAFGTPTTTTTTTNNQSGGGGGGWGGIGRGTFDTMGAPGSTGPLVE